MTKSMEVVSESTTKSPLLTHTQVHNNTITQLWLKRRLHSYVCKCMWRDAKRANTNAQPLRIALWLRVGRASLRLCSFQRNKIFTESAIAH